MKMPGFHSVTRVAANSCVMRIGGAAYDTISAGFTKPTRTSRLRPGSKNGACSAAFVSASTAACQADVSPEAEPPSPEADGVSQPASSRRASYRSPISRSASRVGPESVTCHEGSVTMLSRDPSA